MMHGILCRINIYMVTCILTKHKAFINKMNMHMFLCDEYFMNISTCIQVHKIVSICPTL